MNYSQKFNRALLKAISYNKIEKIDLNAGAIRKAIVKFSFSHDGVIHYMALESLRNAKGMDFFGYKEKHELTLVSWNGSYTSGIQIDIPNDIDASALKYISNYSIISDDESSEVLKSYVQSFNEFQEVMS